MSLENYEIARKHWQDWISDLTDDELNKINLSRDPLPEAPKYSAFLKKKFELLGDSLSGLIAQQQVIRNYRAKLSDVEKRDIIQRETKTEGFVPSSQESRMALKLHVDKRKMLQLVEKSEYEALQSLNLEDSIKSEIARLEKEKNDKEAQNETENKKAIADLTNAIAELQEFLKQLPLRIKEAKDAIDQFTQQQLRGRLSSGSLLDAATEKVATIGSSDDKLNEGKALTDKEKKERMTSVIHIKGRFFNGKLALTVGETANPEGGTDLDYSIPSASFETNKYGLPVPGYLFHSGRIDLIKIIHEHLIIKGKKSFNMDFSSIDEKHLQWHIQLLQASVEVSNQNAQQQLDLHDKDKTVPLFSAHVIDNAPSIASLKALLKKKPALKAQYKGDLKAIQRAENEGRTNRIKILGIEATRMRDNAKTKLSYSNDQTIVAKNAANAAEKLAEAARNKIAVTLDNINLGGKDFSEASKALGNLLTTQTSALAAQEKAKTMVNHAELELQRLLKLHTSSVPKSTALQELESSVALAKDKLQETDVALMKLEGVIKSFHDAFAKIDLTPLRSGLGNLTDTIQALAPAVAQHSPSLERIAQILVDYLEYGNVAGFKEAFDAADIHEKSAMINRAFHVDSKKTMKALTLAYEKMQRDPTNAPQALFSADPVAISANASIDALTPVVAGDDELKGMLVRILVDKAESEHPTDSVDPFDRAAVTQAKFNELSEFDHAVINSLKSGLLHNPVEGLLILNKAYELLKNPKVTPELLATFVNTPFLNQTAAKIARLVAPPRERGPVTSAEISAVKTAYPKEFKAIMDNAFTIADSSSVSEAMNRGDQAKDLLKKATAQCANKVKEAKLKIETNDLAMDLKVADSSANLVSTKMNPAAAIATRKMMINALAHVVERLGADDAVRAIIGATDADVWAALILNNHNADLKERIARAMLKIPNNDDQLSFDQEQSLAATLQVLTDDPIKAKEMLKETLAEKPEADMPEEAFRNQCIEAIGGVIAEIDDVRRGAEVRRALEAESNPAEVLRKINVAAHAAVVRPALVTAANALSEFDVREIAKVDLEACALILHNSDAGLTEALINQLAESVPNFSARSAFDVERLQDARAKLRSNNAGAQLTLRAALAAHPVEAQAAINAVIDKAKLGVVLDDLKRSIAAHPYAAIDTHPLVIEARNRFVANFPEIMAKKHDLVQARQATAGAAEKNPKVIAARNALETATIDAITDNRQRYDDDPGVQKARKEVVQLAQLGDVQAKLYQQLMNNPESIRLEDGVVTFECGSPASTMTLSAEDAREVALQLEHAWEQYFDTVAGAQDMLQAEADEAFNATATAGLSEKAYARITAAKSGLKLLKKLPEQVNIDQAEKFDATAKKPGSALGRLFDASVVNKANDEVAAAEEALATLKEKRAKSIADFPATSRNSEGGGVVGALATEAIPNVLVTNDIINGSEQMPQNGEQSDIQRARARDYIDLINAELKAITRNSNPPFTQKQITDAKLRVFKNKAEVRKARVDALLNMNTDTNPGVQAIFARANNDGSTALTILEEIAEGQYQSVAIGGVSKEQAFGLLCSIHVKDNVRQARNEALDERPNSKKEWTRIAENSAPVKEKDEQIKTTEALIVSKKAVAAKVTDQLRVHDASVLIKKVEKAKEEKPARERERGLTRVENGLTALRDKYNKKLERVNKFV